MHALFQFFTWLLQVSWQASVLILLVMLAQRLFGRWLTARGRALLWLLVTARLLLPIGPGSVVSLFNFAKPEAAAPTVVRWFNREGPLRARMSAAFRADPAPSALPATSSASASLTPATPPASPPMPAAVAGVRRSPSGWFWGMVVWALVGLALGARLLWRNAKFVLQLRRCREARNPDLLDLLRSCRGVMGVRRSVRPVATDLVSGPALYGLLRPRLLLPSSMMGRLTHDEWRFVFMHELAHVKRGDVVLNWLLCLLEIVHWFNPVVWYGFRRMRQDRELACDELVLAKSRGEQSRAYGEAILKVLEYGACPARLPGLVGILETREQLERRIRMIAAFNINARGSVLVGVLLAILGVMTLTDAQNNPGAPGSTAEKTEAHNPAQDPSGSNADPGDVTDPKTGLEFRVVKRITGTNDIIHLDYSRMHLSPNGRFLLWNERLLSLDGRPPVTLNDLMGAFTVAWSPDGRKIAFIAEGIGVLPIAPETGQLAGPVQKLLEDGPFLSKLYWSSDSERILFIKWNSQRERECGSIDLRGGRLIKDPDYADFGLISPDGNTVAYPLPQDGIWARPVRGGISRVALPYAGGLGDDLVLWTPDSQWVGSATGQPAWHTEQFVLGRVADGQTFTLRPPDSVGTFIGKSEDGKKLFYYRWSIEPRLTWKILPVSGGPARTIAAPAGFGALDHQSWSPDGTALAALGETVSGSDPQRFWFMPVDGGKAVPFDMASLGTNAYPWSVSTDHSRLLYLASSSTNERTSRVDFYVAPVSMKEGHATAAGRLVFEGWRNQGSGDWGTWSPDGKRIAMAHRGDEGNELWLIAADGGKAVRVAKTSDVNIGQVRWSPDGRWLAFSTATADRRRVNVMPAAGGTISTVLSAPKQQQVPFGWSPDSQAVVVASEGLISSFTVAGGRAQMILKLADAGCENASWVGWSPDGRHLAFYGGKKNESNRLCMFSPETSRIATLAEDLSDSTLFWGSELCAWSPDGRAIVCGTEEPVRVRPAGVIRELDVAEVINKAMALPQNKPAAATNAPPIEPPIGAIFTDDFNSGPSKHWRFLDLPDTGFGPGRHAVENGELLLIHARACLDVNTWTDYIVSVRVRLKEIVDRTEGNFGIAVRSTPSGFGSARRDRYDLGVFGGRYFWLGINYADASDTLRHGQLNRANCNFVQDKWYTLELEVRGRELRGYLDGKLVIQGSDDRLSKGGLWIGSGGTRVHFDDFSVRQLQ
ncbi:MAG: M56 family metallopeptidase [Verrucomicrobiia bacterium]